jgi:hypothetical protein
MGQYWGMDERTRSWLAAADFSGVPIPEVADVLASIEAAGWTWDQNLPGWRVMFRKNFPVGTSADAAEAELQTLMGEYPPLGGEPEPGGL